MLFVLVPVKEETKNKILKIIARYKSRFLKSALRQAFFISTLLSLHFIQKRQKRKQ